MNTTRAKVKWKGRSVSNFLEHIELHHFKQSKLTARFLYHFLVNILNHVVRTETCINPRRCETTWITAEMMTGFEDTKWYGRPMKVSSWWIKRRIEMIVVTTSPPRIFHTKTGIPLVLEWVTEAVWSGIRKDVEAEAEAERSRRGIRESVVEVVIGTWIRTAARVAI